MKILKPEKYSTLKRGDVVTIETLGISKTADGLRFGPIAQEKGTILNLKAKEKEIKRDGEWTGEYETVPDIVHYTPLESDSLHISSTIGCGMFRIYT